MTLPFCVYRTGMATDGTKSVEKVCETDMQSIADLAAKEWSERIGPAVEVIVIRNNEIIKIVRGTK